MADTLIALLTLTSMEIVLGIDNIVFISILVAKLPEAQQAKARTFGLALALLARLGLLFSISWVMGLTDPLFTVFQKAISGRDLILLVGGLFLIGKSTYEIHDKLEAGKPELETSEKAGRSRFVAVLIQIALIDIVFSLDSVITAVGMVQQISIMVIAMVLSVFVMLLSAGAISRFVHTHPTIKILALSFLLLIGTMLFAEGTGLHIPKGYIYFAMAFSLGVEMINMRYRKTHLPVKLREPQK